MSIQVYLLGRPTFDVEALVSFLSTQDMQWKRTPGATPAEELTEAAGRVCYMSFGSRQSPRQNPEYVWNLIRMGHESVLEHVSWTFLAAGVTRAFTHQLVRHRVGVAFSQLSQQYHDETGAHFAEPAELSQFPEIAAKWRQCIEKSKETYIQILNELRASPDVPHGSLSRRERNRAIHSIARSVLPNATETTIVFTANARALRHILAVRGTIPGDAEMREAMAVLLKVVQAEAPALFADFSIDILPNGSPLIVQQEVLPSSANDK